MQIDRSDVGQAMRDAPALSGVPLPARGSTAAIHRPRGLEAHRSPQARAAVRGLSLCFLLVSLLFLPLATLLLIGVSAWVLYKLLFARSLPVLLGLASLAVCWAGFEYIGSWIIYRRLGQTYNLNVDHRMRPNPKKGINRDGLRCPFESDDFSADTFNVLLLGDSFVYGEFLADSADTLPAQFQARCDEAGLTPRVRAVNGGWTSSSPLLCLRLLREVGARYRPDLVVQFVDITDFGDDLRYRFDLRRKAGSPTMHLVYQSGLSGLLLEWRSHWRGIDPDASGPPEIGPGHDYPADRFFIVNQPLEVSRPWLDEIEANLIAGRDYCRDVLGCPYAIVCHPRHFQYTDRESGRNLEARYYSVLGPHVLEPFRWLREFADRTAIPGISLLDDFRHAREFPLYFEKDPHWNATGCGVAARALFNHLQSANLLPRSTADRGN